MSVIFNLGGGQTKELICEWTSSFLGRVDGNADPEVAEVCSTLNRHFRIVSCDFVDRAFVRL
jgi:hypothetical protein